MAAPWMLLGRVLRLAPGTEDAELEPAATAIPIAVPPELAVITANRSAHPDPRFPDRYPYVLVANPVGLLVNFSSAPFYGVKFGAFPCEANLVLLHELHPIEAEDAELGDMTATIVRLPPRERFDAVIFNLESIGLGVGLVTREEEEVRVTTVEIIISELMIDKGSEVAKIVYCFAGEHDTWRESVRDCQLAAFHREWVPSGVVFYEGRLWWFDLSWGILSCEVSPSEMRQLRFHDLPPGRALDARRPDIHDHRCIAVSGDALRYVEIIVPEGQEEVEVVVAMWTAILGQDDDGQASIIAWEMAYEVSFAAIWNDGSYKDIGLPPMVPVITAVSPLNPNLVYFALELRRRIFGVDVPQHRVVEFVDEKYDLVVPWPATASSRYVLAWLMDDDESESDED